MKKVCCAPRRRLAARGAASSTSPLADHFLGVALLSVILPHVMKAESHRFDLFQAKTSHYAIFDKAFRRTLNAVTRLPSARHNWEEKIMDFGRGVLLWLLGVPIPIIILLALFWHH